jgi:lipoprotein NlpD
MLARCGTKISNANGFLNGSLFAAILSVSILAGCKGTTHLAPVENLAQPPSIKLDYHTVSRGDTLYSIAWRYGMDYHELADINRISSPYTIEIGQKIDLTRNAGSVKSATASRAASGVEVTAVAVDTNAVTEVSVVSPVSPAVSQSKPTTSAAKPVVEQSVKQPVKPVAATQSTSAGRWIWPSNGRIKSGYSATDPLRKGVDLEGQLGDPVLAARSGSVVYAGNGLAGYGELVIIKHDEQFLSAYGHNSRLLVIEGEQVATGQKIAEIGSSGTDSNQLHFEIRLDGKPVDPLRYLPKK